MRYALFFLLPFFTWVTVANGQRTCGSYNYYQNLVKKYPELSARSARVYGENTLPVGIITIPVIVHIVYNTPEQNLSDQDVRSQLDVLNQDFQGSNQDVTATPTPFKPALAGDCQLRFVLKNITRTHTSVKKFDIDLGLDANGGYTLAPQKQAIKFTRLGGIDVDHSTDNLNIWVGNIRAINVPDTGLLGLGTFPGSPTEYDGVLINYAAFGALHAQSPYDKGRTASHEVGHWLNLIHISGDSFCGDDKVDDTPTQEKQNFDNPVFPLVNCNNGPNGAMFMNYMDYVDDKSMFMFTRGQKARMRAVFARNGFRANFRKGTVDKAGNFSSDYHPTPVIATVVQSKNLALVQWSPIKSALEYEVSLKQVKSDHRLVYKTKDNKYGFTGLVPDGLYEVKVTARLEGYSGVSAPFVFIAYRNNFK